MDHVCRRVVAAFDAPNLTADPSQTRATVYDFFVISNLRRSVAIFNYIAVLKIENHDSRQPSRVAVGRVPGVEMYSYDRRVVVRVHPLVRLLRCVGIVWKIRVTMQVVDRVRAEKRRLTVTEHGGGVSVEK